MFSGYKKALKTKQKTMAAFVWCKQSKCKLLSQDSPQKIQKELLQETKHENTQRYDFTNEEKPSERFDDCRVQIVSQASLQRILHKLLQEIKKHATVWLYQRRETRETFWWQCFYLINTSSTAPMRSCVRGRMQFFKIGGFVGKRFLLFPPPLPLHSSFCSRPNFLDELAR